MYPRKIVGVAAALVATAAQGAAAQHERHVEHGDQAAVHEAGMFVEHLRKNGMSDEVLHTIHEHIGQIHSAVQHLQSLHDHPEDAATPAGVERMHGQSEEAMKALHEAHDRVLELLDEEDAGTFTEALREHLKHLLPDWGGGDNRHRPRDLG